MPRSPAILVSFSLAAACSPAPPSVVPPVPPPPVSVAAPEAAMVPAAPGPLVSHRIDSMSRPAFTWTAVRGASGYEVEVASCSSSPCAFGEGAFRARPGEPRFALPRAGLPVGRLALRVRACDASARCSPWGQEAALAGRTIHPVFDFNGDGLADVVVAPQRPPATSRGINPVPLAVIEDMRHLRVYYGAPGALPGKPTLLDAPDALKCAPGVCCTVIGDALAAGDLNGDGFADLVFAGTTFCPDAPDSVLVYYGAAGGLPAKPSRVLTGPAHAWFGQALAVGDVDGDGFADLIVGAPRDGATREGAIYVYRGSKDGIAATPGRLAGPALKSHFGASAAVIGDTDGDGTVELAVSAGEWSWDGPNDGAVYLVSGGAALHLVGDAWRDDAVGQRARFGRTLIGADVNGDGLGDLVIGATLDYGTVYNAPKGATRPAVDTFWGARGGLPRVPSRRHAIGRVVWDQLAAAGDVNGDGFDDFVVSRPNVERAGRGYYIGDVQLYLGGPAGPPEAPSQLIPGGDSKRGTACSNVNGSMGFGEHVAGVGDVNGDGFDDIAVTCTRTEHTLVFLGHAGGLSETPDAELEVAGVMLGGPG